MLFCVFHESTGSTKKSYLASVVFHELCLGKCWELMAVSICLKAERVLIYSELKSVKLLLALSIYIYVAKTKALISCVVRSLTKSLST